jgi:hypothetical protein
MEPQDKVMRLFHKLLNAGEPVNLLNNYRGFPVSYTATVLTLDQGYVAIGIHEHQAVSMALEGKTYIQSKWLPEVIRANVMAVDVVKKRAVLTEFEPAGNEIGKRKTIRVCPSEPLEADIYDGRRHLSGKIADISTNGVGVCNFATYIYGNLSIELEKEVFVDFRLPNTDTVVRFQGVVTSAVDKQGDYLHRLGVRIFPNPELQPLLDAYIKKRQHETERELSLIYDSMCQEKANQGKA